MYILSVEFRGEMRVFLGRVGKYKKGEGKVEGRRGGKWGEGWWVGERGVGGKVGLLIFKINIIILWL